MSCKILFAAYEIGGVGAAANDVASLVPAIATMVAWTPFTTYCCGCFARILQLRFLGPLFVCCCSAV